MRNMRSERSGRISDEQCGTVIDDRLKKQTMIRQVNINAKPFRALGETNSSGIERNVTKDIRRTLSIKPRTADNRI